MVVVDTTVWVDYLKGANTPEVEWLDRETSRQRLPPGFDGLRLPSASALHTKVSGLLTVDTGSAVAGNIGPGRL